MKKLLFVIPTLSGGGAERFVSNLSNYLITKDYQIRILMFEEMTPYYKLDERIEVKSSGYRINRSNRLKSKFQIAWNVLYKAVAFVHREIEAYKPDVVLPFLSQADISVFLVSSRKKSYQLICSERNDPDERSKVMKMLLKHVYKQVDWLVCQSDKVVDYYDSVAKEKKVVIANPIDPSIIPDFVSSESSPKIVAAGRLDFQKNFMLLVNAFADAYSELPEGSTLTVYGEGPERAQLEAMVKSQGLEHVISFPGLSKQLLHKIKDAALFVMSSDFEGFPNALLEAMVVGLPVISTDFPTGTARTLIGVSNGMIVPVRDQKKLAKAIVEMMNDKQKRDEIRARNHELINRYSVKAIAEKWEQLFV